MLTHQLHTVFAHALLLSCLQLPGAVIGWVSCGRLSQPKWWVAGLSPVTWPLTFPQLLPGLRCWIHPKHIRTKTELAAGPWSRSRSGSNGSRSRWVFVRWVAILIGWNHLPWDSSTVKLPSLRFINREATFLEIHQPWSHFSWDSSTVKPLFLRFINREATSLEIHQRWSHFSWDSSTVKQLFLRFTNYEATFLEIHPPWSHLSSDCYEHFSADVVDRCTAFSPLVNSQPAISPAANDPTANSPPQAAIRPLVDYNYILSYSLTI